MTVYVESNFVLEIALGQEQASSAERILENARLGRVALAIPTITLFEPFYTTIHKGDMRRERMNRILEVIKDMKRSRPHEAEVKQLEPMAPLFTLVQQRELSRLTETVRRLFEAAAVVEVSGVVYGEAIALASDYGFEKLTDAIVAAAVLDHLGTNTSAGPHYFATKDRNDFSSPELVQRFAVLD